MMNYPSISYFKDKKFSSSSSPVANAVYPSGKIISDYQVISSTSQKFFLRQE